MKKFKFSMQKILDIKQKNREQEELSYAQLVQMIIEEEKQLAELENERQLLQEELLACQVNGISIVEIMNKQKYIEHLDYVIEKQIKKIKQYKEKLELKRQRLIEVKIEEKKYSRLREKKLYEYIMRDNKLEQIELDEIASRI